MSHLKVSLGFAKETDQGLANLAQEIITAMTGNTSYATPPATMAELKAATDAFTGAMAIQWSGGPEATADKNSKRGTLIDLLVKLGSYVQITAGSDLAVLLSSGFSPINTTHVSSPLATPELVTITNGGTGELIVKVRPVPHARAYEVRHAPADAQPAVWEESVFTQSRGMRIPNLASGKRYVLQVRAVGGSTGQSDWSDQLQHMSL